MLERVEIREERPRRITAAETALVHPITADLWVVIEGGGTLTTGGVLEYDLGTPRMDSLMAASKYAPIAGFADRQAHEHHRPAADEHLPRGHGEHVDLTGEVVRDLVRAALHRDGQLRSLHRVSLSRAAESSLLARFIRPADPPIVTCTTRLWGCYGGRRRAQGRGDDSGRRP